jgi:hypothetical protein
MKIYSSHVQFANENENTQFEMQMKMKIHSSHVQFANENENTQFANANENTVCKCK